MLLTHGLLSRIRTRTVIKRSLVLCTLRYQADTKQVYVSRAIASCNLESAMDRFPPFRGFSVAFNAHARARGYSKARYGHRYELEFRAYMTHRKKAVPVWPCRSLNANATHTSTIHGKNRMMRKSRNVHYEFMDPVAQIEGCDATTN